MTDTSMTCERMDDVLAGYVEGDLDPRTRASVEAHLGQCLRCAKLVRDLRGIQHGASQLPELSPARDLWHGIAERIEAPVIPLQARERPRVAARSAYQLAIAASVLIAVTAGLTYTLTLRRAQHIAPSAIASETDGSRGRNPEGTAVPRAPIAGPPAGVTGPRASQTVARHENLPAVVTYDREIAQLRGILDLRRDDLDPATVAVVENSLTTIDRAITEARTALARDSASAFLHDQLNKALEKKLGLLRTVALLPPRA